MEAYPNNAPITIQPTIPASQTIIQVNQVTGTPMMPRGPPREWTTDVCACCDDMTICLCTIFVPCYPCMLAADMNESCCVPMCIPNAGISMRAVVRSRHNISGNLMNDCVAMSCCGFCATCQLAREVQMIKSGRAIP
ncbi:cornifelin homolog [Strongylocentrotus purpuratus]|uniref:Cornifelin homolog n=1 Tax=Strongylocentrotus purpuratus TaxID=7668 RepID=A0A7M7PBL3_STRPU|nr:cornifelin homolog [Strongylocentrotus purpuratus]XP_030848813.1 cornifelin homolog [Strongylocentrotus purpuratus]